MKTPLFVLFSTLVIAATAADAPKYEPDFSPQPAIPGNVVKNS